jgi:DUF1009 family protein
LAIIAGGGAMPGLLAAASVRSGRAVRILAIENEAEAAAIAAFPHEWISWRAMGLVPQKLAAAAIRDVVMIGNIRHRPDIGIIGMDAPDPAISREIGAFLKGGDNQILVGAIAFLERHGFRVLGVHEVLTDLVAKPGPVTKNRPSPADEADIALAAGAAETIGALDIGQAAIAVNQRVVALEAAEGTDDMIARVRDLRAAGRLVWEGRAGVLCKSAKPQQDLRVDMPAIGPRTVDAVAEAGLAGIGIEAGRVMIVERAETLRRADAAGLFIAAFDSRQR